MECVTPKLQAFLECGLRLHSNDRSAEWKLKWSAICHSKGVHSVRWSPWAEWGSFIPLSGNCLSPKQNFVFVISSTCPVLNWEWSEIWIELIKWSASLHSALQSNSWSGVLSGLLPSTIQKMDWIDKWIALQKQLWIWIVDCTPKMPECQMPWEWVITD